MSDYYREAHQLYLQTNGDVYPYSLLNWLAGEVVLRELGEKCGLQQPDELKQISEWLARAERIAAQHDHNDPSFWNAVIKPECSMVRGLLDADLEQFRHEVVKGYLEARRRGVSAREFRSVTEHIDFLLALLPATSRSIIEPLQWIRKQLL
jgi:hypothetical protein